MATSKIFLEQGKHNPKQYTVKKLVNRVVPEIGTVLKRDEVEKLMTETVGLTVEITENKKR